ncbi:MAG: 50S ribosome-binding GTPase, partial [Lachnospiraceae bacterium]|nr:50S ribosome-binding GTPase [Lachnospiraceae bacterium]
FIRKSTAPIVEKYKSKGMNKTVRCMIAGIPNSGKSTFINMICGKSKVKSEDRPGVTRANQWIKVGKTLELLDTPGVLWPKLDDKRTALNLSFVGSIKDEIMDIEELACKLLERLGHGYYDSIQERYDIWERDNGLIMLEQLCKRRGFILKGDEYDYERGAKVLLDEFRGGVLGHISLEKPENEENEQENP